MEEEVEDGLEIVEGRSLNRKGDVEDEED